MGIKPAIKKITAIQSLALLLITVGCFVFGDLRAAYSAMLGGGVSVVVTLYFAGRVFSAPIGSSAGKITRGFYAGQFGKLLLTILLLGAALLWLPVTPLPLLLAYIITLLAYWLSLPFVFHASNVPVRMS